MTAISGVWAQSVRLWWRAPLVVVAFILSFGPAAVLMQLVEHAMTHQTVGSLAMIGVILGVSIAWWLVDRLEFVNTYGHELAHMIAALTLFRRVTEFRASSENGGQVSYWGEPSLWVASAPYTFPLMATLAGIVALFQHGGTRAQVMAGAIGFFIGYHLAVAVQHTYRNIRVRAVAGSPTDFTTFGRLWTCLYIWTLNVAIVGTLFSFAAGGTRGVQRFWRDAGRVVVHRGSSMLE